MALFGIPPCPYCKKRANIINLWKIKKHGEYRCPRCKGISNIYLSPLVYVFAVIAIASGFMVYFSDRFIFANLTYLTPVKVLIPFVAFFVLSIFTVMFKKPVIKKFRKTPDGRYFDTNGKEYIMRLGKLISVRNKKINNNHTDYNRDEYESDYDDYDEPEDYLDNGYSDAMDISSDENFNKSVRAYRNEKDEEDFSENPILPYAEDDVNEPLLDFDEEQQNRRNQKSKNDEDEEFNFLDKL